LETEQQEKAECRTSKVGRQLFGDTKQGDEAATGRVEEEAVESETGGNETREKLSLTLDKSRLISINLDKSRKISINLNKSVLFSTKKSGLVLRCIRPKKIFSFLFCILSCIAFIILY
jgi:hypothetical protein